MTNKKPGEAGTTEPSVCTLTNSVDEYVDELERLEAAFCEPGLAYGFWWDLRCACDHCFGLRNKIANLKVG